MMRNALASAPSTRSPMPSTPPKRPEAKLPSGDVVADLVDDVEPVVEVLDLPVALELVEPLGGVVGDLGDLVGDDRDDRPQEQRHRDEEEHDHHVTARPRRSPRRSNHSTDGLRPGREEQRDDDEDQHAADALDLVEQPARHHEAEATEEADVERRVPVEARAGPAEVGIRAPSRPASAASVARRPSALGPGGDLLGAGAGARGRRVACSAGFRRPKINRRALSSASSRRRSPKPATTSRSEASWAVIASRRLAHPVDLGADAGQLTLRLGLGRWC